MNKGWAVGHTYVVREILLSTIQYTPPVKLRHWSNTRRKRVIARSAPVYYSCNS